MEKELVSEEDVNKLRKITETSFQSIGEVQEMIKRLQLVEQYMKNRTPGQTDDDINSPAAGKKSNCNGLGSDHPKTFDDIELIDFANLETDSWHDVFPELANTPCYEESDTSFLDVDLLNVRYSLLNIVKAAMNEEQETKATQPVRKSQEGKLNPKIDISPIQSSIIQKIHHSHSPPNVGKTKNRHVFLDKTAGIMSSAPYSSASFVPSNGIQADIGSENSQEKRIDTRTYTRPKKNRFLETSMKIFSSRGLEASEVENSQRRLSVEGVVQCNNHENLNETFVVQEDYNNEENQDRINESRGENPKRVTRNLSYVIRRESESSSYNDENENVQRTMNCSFTVSNEDDLCSSQSGSTSSLHNKSIDALHVKARDQERELRMSSIAATISRQKCDRSYALPVVDATLPKRTSSTDTYCVQSNPDSPGSSGLSSPLDAGSNEILQKDSVGRSMPNLAIMKGMPALACTKVPMSSDLYHKPHHISDSRLVFSSSCKNSREGSERRDVSSRLRVYQPRSPFKVSNNGSNIYSTEIETGLSPLHGSVSNLATSYEINRTFSSRNKRQEETKVQNTWTKYTTDGIRMNGRGGGIPVASKSRIPAPGGHYRSKSAIPKAQRDMSTKSFSNGREGLY